MAAVEILEAFGDNYIYLVEYGPGVCFAVDPGDAGPVEALVSQRNVKLTHILATHHHSDHIGGIAELKNKSGCQVIGASEVKGVDSVVNDGDMLELGDLSICCIATPGHTASGICYYVSGQKPEAPALFTGDTLFAFGCGRLFGGDAEIMYQSLKKLAALPDQTRVYPGHDYTEENLQFALTFEPDNKALNQKLNEVRQNIRNGRPTVPSTLAEEKQLNPFLKARTRQEFAALRKQKDTF
jgi:hydroxyacylglutathione hydrolase